jgi:hypothetical protein
MCADSRRSLAIPVESGTLADECLNQRGGRALRRIYLGRGSRPVDPVIRVADELDRGRRVPGALPDDKCRPGATR